MVGKIWKEEFGQLGLSPSHGYLLFAIVTDESLSQKQLSELLGLDQSTMTRFIDNLIEKGLISKCGKGKGSALSPTTKGTRVHEKVSLLMDQLYSRMQSQIGKKRFSKFVTELQDLREVFKKG